MAPSEITKMLIEAKVLQNNCKIRVGRRDIERINPPFLRENLARTKFKHTSLVHTKPVHTWRPGRTPAEWIPLIRLICKDKTVGVPQSHSIYSSTGLRSRQVEADVVSNISYPDVQVALFAGGQ